MGIFDQIASLAGSSPLALPFNALDYATLGQWKNNQAVNNSFELMDHSSKLEQQNWQERFNQESEFYSYWNTPANQVERLREAGFNPYVYGNNNAVTTGASNSSPSPSAGSPSGSFTPPETGTAGVVQSLNAAVLTPAERALKQAQTKKEVTQADTNEAETRYKQVMTAFQQVMQDKVLPAQVRELVSRAQKQFAEAGVAHADTKLKIAQKVLTELEQEYRKTQNEEVRQRILLLHKEIENYDANSEAQRAALKSQAGLQFSQQMGQDLANDFSVQTLSARVDAELAECSSREEQAKLAKSRLESLEALRNTAVGRWFDNSIEYVCNHLRGIIGGTAVVPLRGKTSAPITPVPTPTE